MRAAHRLHLAAAAFAALAGNGCGPLQACPEGWEAESTDDGFGRCIPPEGYAEKVRARLGTGLYGWATVARGEFDSGGDLEQLTCAPDEIEHASTSMRFTLRDPDDPPQYSQLVEIRRDGTWEARVEPGRLYGARSNQLSVPPPDERFLELRSGESDVATLSGLPNGQFTLADGQVGLVEARLLTCRR